MVFALFVAFLAHYVPPTIEPLYSRGCSRSSEVASGVADLANNTIEKIEMAPKEITDSDNCNTSHNIIEKLETFLTYLNKICKINVLVKPCYCQQNMFPNMAGLREWQHF